MSKIEPLSYFKIETSSDIPVAVKSHFTIENNVNENLKKYPSNVKNSIQSLSTLSNSLKNVYALTKGTNENVQLIGVIGKYQTLINDYNMACGDFLQKCIDCLEDIDFSISSSKKNVKESVSMLENSSYSATQLSKETSKFVEFSNKIEQMVHSVSQDLSNALKNKDGLNSDVKEILNKLNDGDVSNELLNSNLILESNKVLKSFWEKVSQQCKALSDISNIKGLSTKIEGSDGLTNYENAIKLVGYSWLALAHMVQSLSQPLIQIKKDVDSVMSDLPSSSSSIAIIKKVCENLKSNNTSTTNPTQ